MDQRVVSLCDIRGASAAPAMAFEEGKGHVSVNPVYGCSVGCPFCINQADPWRSAAGGSGRVVLASALELLAALERDASTVSQLKLSLMDFCDPFEPALEPTLRHLLAGINERLPGQAVLLTTRLRPDDDLLRWMAGLDNLRLSLFVSLADACGGVRPVTPVRPRLDLLQQSAQLGLHTVMLLRPLVQEWTVPSVLRRLLVHAADTCHEVVMAGLSLEPIIEASLRAAGWPVPARPADAHGGVDPLLKQEVLAMARELLGHHTPLSEHRSCAVNRHRGLPCKVAQKRPCFSPEAPEGSRGPAPEPQDAERKSEDAQQPGGLSRLESSEWRALSGEPPLRIKACSCLSDIRTGVTTRACIGFCCFDATEEPQRFRPRDRAGYCLVKAA